MLGSRSRGMAQIPSWLPLPLLELDGVISGAMVNKW
jgi:hypothetical protein